MKKNLGIVLSIFGGIFGLTGLFTGGPIAMIFLLIIYYFGVGFVITEFTDFADNIMTWLFDLLKC